jgi:hypothetical protein
MAGPVFFAVAPLWINESTRRVAAKKGGPFVAIADIAARRLISEIVAHHLRM